ncbi:hypothetical protein LNI98_12245 [Tenacibaculum dicentrarchi]|nr:hypothetical protein [Tenacibaculum dicentrarchi]
MCQENSFVEKKIKNIKSGKEILDIQVQLDMLFAKIKKIENKIEFKQEIDIKDEMFLINSIAYSIQLAQIEHKKSQDS